MKWLIRLYHFLGSIHFAITLIGLTAVFVAAGTFLEAYTDSHLFSASWTYQNPVFLALIWGFFINILFSALRRWPFRTKHIPFLTTHLGLLMLLGGVIIKSHYGIQGSMSVMEGGTTSRIFVPNTYFLQIEGNNRIHHGKKMQIAIENLFKRKKRFDDLEIRVADYAQHSSQSRETWIKSDQTCVISGLKPIPVIKFTEESMPSTPKVRFHHNQALPWNVLALTADQVGEVAKQVYMEGISVTISDRKDGHMMTKIPLQDALVNPIIAETYKIAFSIDWNFSLLTGLENPSLLVDLNGEKMVIALSGENSLMNRNESSPYRGKFPVAIDLSREPTLLIVQDSQKDDHLFFFNPYGEMQYTVFRNDKLQYLVVYDQGFGGYAVQTSFPFDNLPASRQEKEAAELLHIAAELRQNLEKNPELSPPLKLLKKAADKSHRDFTETVLLFLQAWDNSSELLLSELPSEWNWLIQSLDWNQVSEQEQYACGWLCFLLEEIEREMQQGKSFSLILQEKGWPLAQQFANFDVNHTDHMITLFAQQLFAAISQLPKPNIMPEAIPIKALSAYLRTFGVTLNNIRQSSESHQSLRMYHAVRLYTDAVRKILAPLDHPSPKVLVQLIESMADDSRLLAEIKKAYIIFQKHTQQKEVNYLPTKEEIGQVLFHYAPLEKNPLTFEKAHALSQSLDIKEVILETPLTLEQKKIPALQKWEDNSPLVTLEIKKGQHKEFVTLTYDKYGKDLARPILNGEYRLRFQPLFVEIPYKVRLHDARQINYPNSNQAYSYEGDIIVTDLRDKTRIEKTISMNHVHETKDGYRFYLASLSPSDEIAPQHVQIVVNYDPVKYLLTYPGAMIMCLGIILLFWLRPYKERA